MQYRSTRKAVFSVKYHVIWCPKYRSQVLGGAAELRLKQIIDEVVCEFAGIVIEVETMRDYVHLLVELPPQVAVSKLVQILKGRSSRRLRQEFAHLAPMKCLWAPSWFVSTVGGAPLEVVRRYVENQKLAAARKPKAA
jgi:putative transposase